VGVTLLVGVTVSVGVTLGVPVGEIVTVGVAVPVRITVGVMLGVPVTVAVGTGVSVLAGCGLAIAGRYTAAPLKVGTGVSSGVSVAGVSVPGIVCCSEAVVPAIAGANGTSKTSSTNTAAQRVRVVTKISFFKCSDQ
jgi:hypothetical protein